MAAASLTTLFCLLIFIFLMVVILLGSAIKKVPENEKWVVSRLGDTFVKGPGWTMQIPMVDQVVKVDMAEQPTNIQDQTCITNDRAPAIIHMLVYSRVIDPLKFATQAGRTRQDFAHLASSTLKELVSARMLDQILSARDELGEAICNKLNQEIDPSLGLRIDKVKVMEIVVSKEILAAMPAPSEPPSECPACGAPLNSTGSQGLHQVKCEYCGFLIKL
jgi:regulator of protease activity HflC (stomatin/prohibitin superfamily)